MKNMRDNLNQLYTFYLAKHRKSLYMLLSFQGNAVQQQLFLFQAIMLHKLLFDKRKVMQSNKSKVVQLF